MKISIIVSTYNEGNRAVKTINKILEFSKNPVIVVDDGSNQMSRDLLNNNFSENSQISLVFHKINMGKGKAMKTGIEKAFKNNSQSVIFIDADGQHDPKLLPQFEKALKKDQLVFGYRLLKENVPLIRKVGNFIVRKVVHILFGIKRHDLLCGFFGMNLSLYKQLEWSASNYGVETEIATKIGRLDLPFSEIKINTTYLDDKSGMTLLDAFKVLIKIPIWYFRK